MTLIEALVPLMELAPDASSKLAELRQVGQEEFESFLTSELSQMRQAKLGLLTWDEGAEQLWSDLCKLMEESAADYTIVFRELSTLSEGELSSAASLVRGKCSRTEAYCKLRRAFYHGDELHADQQQGWERWLAAYARRLLAEGRPHDERRREMARSSPKYVPREWMLARAYKAAQADDYSVVHEMARLFEKPYDEQPEFEAEYYRCAGLV